MIPARSHWYAILIVLLILIPAGAAAVSGIQVALGDTVPLSGYSYGSDWAYLFLTGPNLPVNGVMLNDVNKRADQGYFTKVQTDGDGHWTYKWSTANLGGRLDEGTYTIWVVNGPNDLSRLAQADYATIPVTLGKPTLSVDTQQAARYGSMDIASSPTGASIMLNDQYRGQTPLTVSDLSPGQYRLNLTHYGYNPISSPVTVLAGRVSQISATLDPRQDIPPVTTTTTEVGVTPLTPARTPVPTPKAAGTLPAIALLGMLFLVRQLSRSQ